MAECRLEHPEAHQQHWPPATPLQRKNNSGLTLVSVSQQNFQQ